MTGRGTSSEDPHSPVPAGYTSARTTHLPSRGLSCPGADRDPPVTTATPSSLQSWQRSRDKYVTITVVETVTAPKLLNPLW